VTGIIDACFRYSLILQTQDFFIEQYGILYKFFFSQESTVRFRISFYAFYLHGSRSDFISVQNLGDTKALTRPDPSQIHNTLLLFFFTVLHGYEWICKIIWLSAVSLWDLEFFSLSKSPLSTGSNQRQPESKIHAFMIRLDSYSILHIAEGYLHFWRISAGFCRHSHCS
jgi:hypothetical protein